MPITRHAPTALNRTAWFSIGGLVVSLCMTSAGPALADHPSVGPGTAAGPVITIPATPMPTGKWAVGVRSEIIEFDRFSDQELAGFAAAGQEAHSVDQVRAHSLSLGYGVTEKFNLYARLPFVERDSVREGEFDGINAEAHRHGDADGIGDLTLLGLYRFLEQEKSGADMALLAGLKMPTGETTEEDRQGIEFETEFQPGSGSWDPMLGLAASQRIGAYSLDANVLYVFSREGSRQTDLGDVFSYNAALSYRLGGAEHHHDHEDHGDHDNRQATENREHGHASWDLILELNGERRQKERIAGMSDSHSGGNVVYLSPGVRFTAADNWAAFASVGVPVIDNTNGIQTDISYRVIAGIGFAF